MEKLTIPKSDYGYELTFSVQDANGAAYDLSASTVTFKAWSPLTPSTLIVNATCSKSTTVTGQCTYTIASTDFTTAGQYLAELELTRTGVKESTEPIMVIVRDNA